MGESNVFTFFKTAFIGLGISYESLHAYKRTGEKDPSGIGWIEKEIRVPCINLVLPFLTISIYFRKSQSNKWI